MGKLPAYSQGYPWKPYLPTPADVRISSPPLKNTFGHGAKTAVTRASGPPRKRFDPPRDTDHTLRLATCCKRAACDLESHQVSQRRTYHCHTMLAIPDAVSNENDGVIANLISSPLQRDVRGTPQTSQGRWPVPLKKRRIGSRLPISTLQP